MPAVSTLMLCLIPMSELALPKSTDPEPEPPKLDRRSLKQKVQDQTTVGEINEMREWNVQLADWFSRSLGAARGPVTLGVVVAAVAAYAMDIMSIAA